MKYRGIWMGLLAGLLALPVTGLAQDEDEDCPCRRRGMIGITFDTDGETNVVRVTDVRRGSPAERAGVQEGDVVIRLNGDAATIERMSTLPMELQAGDTVQLRVRGERGERDVVVVAAARPGGLAFGIEPNLARERMFVLRDSLEGPLHLLEGRLDSLHVRLRQIEPTMHIRVDSVMRLMGDSLNVVIAGARGAEVRALELAREGMFEQSEPFFLELGRRSAAGAQLAEMNEGLARYFGGQREGALVIEVGPETPAARAGLEAGDVIVRAGSQLVEDPDDMRRALMRDEDGNLELVVIRQGQRRMLNLAWTREDDEVRVFQRRLEPTRTQPRRERRP